jgi:hypothetical protein
MRSISVCHPAGVAYNQQVRLVWQFLTIATLAAFVPFLTGCGGIQASKSVSPASFFMPGIMLNVPASVPATNLVASTTPEVPAEVVR